ncbi:MAG: hybrid sensory histidine kinase BarA [Methanosaeta sp. PtaU1.Bin112]|nr:MAG: hybrid sensory histidine kinase BarA [Methanosaeta sp. PtaU1.Bin112]
MGEEILAGGDCQKKIELMMQKIAKMRESGPTNKQMAESLSVLQKDLDDLLHCLPARCLQSYGRNDSAILKDSDNEIQKMTRAIEALPSDIVLTDLKGKIEYVNASLLKNSGFSDISELKGLSVFDFTNGEGKSKLQEEIIPTLHSTGRWQGELLIKRMDGQSYMAEMICALIKDYSDKPTYLLANFFNITDRKHWEEALLLDDSRLEALQRLNQMDEASIQEITDFALEAGVKLTGSELGYVAFVDDKEETLFMHSWSKKAMQMCNVENKKKVYNLQETGLWGEAIRERRAIITNDYASCPQRRGVPEGHVDIIRHMNVPIMDKGKIVIVAGLANKEEEYDDSDVRQLTLLMSGMWKIIQRREAEEALHRRDLLLEEAARATNYLLTPDPQAITRALGILGKAEDVDRVHVLENRQMHSEMRLESLLLQWFREPEKPFSGDLSWVEHFADWREALSRRESIQGITGQISHPSAKLLEDLGIASFLLLPVFIEEKLFAVVCFEDCRNERRWIDSEISVLQAAAGSIGEAILRRRTEEALRKTQEGLEKSVAERTAWLLRANEALQEEMVKHRETEMELRSAQQAADAACRAKSEFLANMSHEIRTPMNAVIGLAGLLLETKLTEEQRDFVETIHSSGDALLAIINDILDFSKIDEGKMKLEHLPFILQESIESSLNMVATKAAEKGLDLRYDIDKRIAPTILGDSVRLRQVLANLLSNAVKFTDRGSITIRVQPGETEDEIQFSVTDTGIGIGPDDMRKLFHSFSQVDASTSRKYGGTGLGLAISKRLVELMGGRIWAQSKPGEGSSFIFCIYAPSFSGDVAAQHLAGKKVMALLSSVDCLRMLSDYARSWGMQIHPVVSSLEARELTEGRFDAVILDLDVPGARELAEEMEEQIPIIILSAPDREVSGKKTLIKPFSQDSILFALQEALAPSRHKKMRPASGKSRHSDLSILLAEDNPVNQKVARLMLKKLGYRAEVACNGKEVLQAISRKSYDVILMDVQMPEMDGLETTRAILDLNLEKRPKVLAMTAYALEGDKERCLLAGMDGYISKPVQLDELRRALSSLQDAPCDEDKTD